MRMVAILKNDDHPEYGEVSMPLPIKASEYGHCMELLSSLGIGDALNKDCQVEELTRAYPTLRCLEGCKVNIDELDYLAKRLDGFDAVEISQFQAMADKLKLTDMKDLINLTFSCQQATVIADFSDLESVGRAHYMNTHDGCASAEELDNLDGEETAILLIEDNKGTVTRYGVVYDNGMQLSQLYDGKNLPRYHHENDCISVGLTSQLEPGDTKNITWVYLPTSNCQIERAMKRAGITDPRDLSLRMGDSLFPMEIDVALDFPHEDNTTWAAYHVIGQGEDIYFKTSAVDTLLIAAKRLRTYLTKNDTHQSGSFAAVFKDRLEITKEEYDQLLGQRLENTGKVSGLFEVDFDKEIFSAVSTMDGWHTFRLHDVSVAAYHAFCKQNISTDQRWDKAKTLYEDAKYHNCVFVGTDEQGVPRHAHKRSCNSVGKAFRQNIEGSDPRYSFHHIGIDRKLFVFEAPIDLLSYITINPEDWQAHSYVACCGTSAIPVLSMLERMSAPKEVYLCLDNDQAGETGSLRMAEKIAEQFNIASDRLSPHHKDWNDDLCVGNQEQAQAAMSMGVQV